MAETIKVKMRVSRGVPGGGIIRAGATVEIAAFWANQFIADGTAELVEKGETAAPSAKGKKNGKHKS